MSSLHMSALDIVTRDLDQSQVRKHKNIINKRFVFSNYVM
jgi:hypothetical protein